MATLYKMPHPPVQVQDFFFFFLQSFVNANYFQNISESRMTCHLHRAHRVLGSGSCGHTDELSFLLNAIIINVQRVEERSHPGCTIVFVFFSFFPPTHTYNSVYVCFSRWNYTCFFVTMNFFTAEHGGPNLRPAQMSFLTVWNSFGAHSEPLC